MTADFVNLKLAVQMSSMSSIRSVLIKTSMSTIQKEISQLEHWLNNLQDVPSNTSCDTIRPDLPNLHHIIDRLSEQTYNQQLILNNIIERLDIIEGYNSNREVFIDKNDAPWIDNQCEPLQNEMNDNSELCYTVYKNESDNGSDTNVIITNNH